jgi:hypothetical protein
VTFALNWTGNVDNVFSTPASVTLPLNKPTQVKIAIAPKAAGAHSAMLTLDNSAIPGHSYRMLATIVAGEQLNAGNKYTNQLKTEVPRPEMRSFFYDVPVGASALRVDIESPTREVAVAVVRPDTRTANAVRATPGAAAGRGGGAGGAGAANRRSTYVVSDPMPGVWEIRLSDLADMNTFDAMQAEKDEPVPPTKATLTVSTIGVDVSAQNATGGNAATRDVTIANRMATFNGKIAGVTVGGAKRERPTIRHGQQLTYEIDVPEGSSSLLVRASEVADKAADLDLYVIDCTGKQCRAPQTDSDPLGDEVVTITNPAAGKWKVVVDGASVPAGSTTFAYLDVVFNPTYGSVVTGDLAKEHKIGEQWTAQAHTWLAGALPTGRQPFTAVQLQGALSGGVTFGFNLYELTTGATATSTSSSQR